MMVLCLVFLTSINFFLYPAENHSIPGFASDQKPDIPPSGPTEEKSCSGGPSMLEEFLHTIHPVLNFGIDNELALHRIAEDGKIRAYHGELLYPPPEWYYFSEPVYG